MPALLPLFCARVPETIKLFRRSRSSLAKPPLLSTQCSRKSAPRRRIQALAVADQQPNNAPRSKYRSNAAYASGLAYWAAQRIFNLAGARAIDASSEIGESCSNAARSATRLHQYRRAQARSHQPPANKLLALVNRFVPALTVLADDDAHFDWRRLFAASCGVGRWPIAV
jgi:hypothetical protein